MYTRWKEMGQKRAEMGVGTLIVFIAMLLVAAVAAGVLIQTAGSLQEKSLSTGQQAKSQISTNARVIEVSATDGHNGNLTDFTEIIKLSPGSDPIKLDQIIFTFNTKDKTSTLKYRGEEGICRKNNTIGYNTWNEESLPAMNNWRGRDTTNPAGVASVINNLAQRETRIDLDDDGAMDYIGICYGSTFCPTPYNNSVSTMVLNLSTDGMLYFDLVDGDGSLVNLNAGDGYNITGLKVGHYAFIRGYRTSGGQTAIWTTQDLPATAFFKLYKMPYALDEDYDDDGEDDFFAINDTHALLILSSGHDLSVALGNNIATGLANLSIDGRMINSTGSTVAYVRMNGEMSALNQTPRMSVTPFRLGEGYFAAVYEQDGTNHVAGNLQRGDILKLCFEAPGQITEDDEVRLNFIPKIGTATLTQFVTPDVISTERVYLYP
jgi:flagellin-like protein